jgi:hypothetical protein
MAISQALPAEKKTALRRFAIRRRAAAFKRSGSESHQSQQ